MATINWYPGHMAKSRRMLIEQLRAVDAVVELVDARAPLSSANPDLRGLTRGKARLLVLNKADLADPAVTKEWIAAYKKKGLEAIALDSRNRDFIGSVKAAAARLSEEKRQRDQARGITEQRPVKALICGIPNIGKSTFINSVLGKASAKTGNKPGVTKGNQWITVSNEFMLLDTPGVLWPRFESEEVGEALALMGSINDDILNIEDLCIRLIERLRGSYPEALGLRYDISEEELDRALESYETVPLGGHHSPQAWMSETWSGAGLRALCQAHDR